jgi:hypothetical protein
MPCLSALGCSFPASLQTTFPSAIVNGFCTSSGAMPWGTDVFSGTPIHRKAVLSDGPATLSSLLLSPWPGTSHWYSGSNNITPSPVCLCDGSCSFLPAPGFFSAPSEPFELVLSFSFLCQITGRDSVFLRGATPETRVWDAGIGFGK